MICIYMIKHGPVLEVYCWKVGLVRRTDVCARNVRRPWGSPSASLDALHTPSSISRCCTHPIQHLRMLHPSHPASPDAAPIQSSISGCCTLLIQHLWMLYPPHPQPLLAGPGCSVPAKGPRLVSWECEPRSYVHTKAPSLQGLQAVAVGILRFWTWKPIFLLCTDANSWSCQGSCVIMYPFCRLQPLLRKQCNKKFAFKG